MPFLMAQVNLPACYQRPFNAEHQAGKAVNSNFKVIGLTRLGIETQSTALKSDALTIRPSELLIGHAIISQLTSFNGVTKQLQIG